MSRRKGIMSDALKYEFAKELGVLPSSSSGDFMTEASSELGVYNTEQSIDWGSVSSRDCGNMVKLAIQMAERNYAKGNLME